MDNSLIYLLLAMGVGFLISKTLRKSAASEQAAPKNEAERKVLVDSKELELRRIEKELKEKLNEQKNASSKENEDFWKKD